MITLNEIKSSEFIEEYEYIEEGDYLIININDELKLQVKKEVEGYVIDAYKPDNRRKYDDECINTMTIWNDDILSGGEEDEMEESNN